MSWICEKPQLGWWEKCPFVLYKRQRVQLSGPRPQHLRIHPRRKNSRTIKNFSLDQVLRSLQSPWSLLCSSLFFFSLLWCALLLRAGFLVERNVPQFRILRSTNAFRYSVRRIPNVSRKPGADCQRLSFSIWKSRRASAARLKVFVSRSLRSSTKVQVLQQRPLVLPVPVKVTTYMCRDSCWNGFVCSSLRGAFRNRQIGSLQLAVMNLFDLRISCCSLLSVLARTLSWECFTQWTQ